MRVWLSVSSVAELQLIWAAPEVWGPRAVGRIIDNLQIDNRQIVNRQIDNRQIDNLTNFRQIDNLQIDNWQIDNLQMKFIHNNLRSMLQKIHRQAQNIAGAVFVLKAC